MGSKNHEIVPTPLIEKLSNRRGGASAVRRSISTLAKFGLIRRVREAKYDGYRLSYGGLDYLALHAHAARKHVYSVGSRIGVGKESDVVVVADETGAQRVLKIHRLGRVSFRSVKTKRDYLGRRHGGSWMYLSRLSAMREFAFMRALRAAGFPVPDPIGQSRHTVVMSYEDAFPLRQIADVPDPAGLYAELIALVLRLAKHGLIHGDFNEFNILIKEEQAAAHEPGSDDGPGDDASGVVLIPILIDFPQMVSMEHPNADMYFSRDVACIKRFFERRFHFVPSAPGPFYRDAKKTVGKDGAVRIDAAVEASGFTKKMAKELEAAIQEQQAAPDVAWDDDDDDDEDNEGGEEEEEEREEGGREEEEEAGPPGGRSDEEDEKQMPGQDIQAGEVKALCGEETRDATSVTAVGLSSLSLQADSP